MSFTVAKRLRQKLKKTGKLEEYGKNRGGMQLLLLRWNVVNMPDFPHTIYKGGMKLTVEQSGETVTKLRRNPCRRGNSVTFFS